MYYIYHIQGIKIGCTTQPEKRTKQQGFDTYSILETHDDIYKVSDREIELQKEYGYKVDNIPYWMAIKHFDKAKSKVDYQKAGKRLGEWAKASGHLQKISVLGGKIQGERNKTNGHMDAMRNVSNYNKKSIIVHNRFTNELVGEWESLTQCGKDLGLLVPKISVCVNGKRKWHREYTFNYKSIS